MADRHDPNESFISERGSIFKGETIEMGKNPFAHYKQSEQDKIIFSNRLKAIGRTGLINNQMRELYLAKEIIDEFGGFASFRELPEVYSGDMNAESYVTASGKRVLVPKSFIKNSKDQWLTDLEVAQKIANGADPSNFIVTDDLQKEFDQLSKNIKAANQINEFDYLLSLQNAQRSNSLIHVNDQVGKLLGIDTGLHDQNVIARNIHTHLLTNYPELAVPDRMLKNKDPLSGIFRYIQQINANPILNPYLTSKDFKEGDMDTLLGQYGQMTKRKREILHQRSEFIQQYSWMMNELKVDDDLFKTQHYLEAEQILSGAGFSQDEALSKVNELYEAADHDEVQAIRMLREGGFIDEKAGSELAQWRNSRDKNQLELQFYKAISLQDGNTIKTIGEEVSLSDLDANVHEKAREWQHVVDRGGRYRFPKDVVLSTIKPPLEGSLLFTVQRDHQDIFKEVMVHGRREKQARFQIQFETDLEQAQKLIERFEHRMHFQPNTTTSYADSMHIKAGRNTAIEVPLTDELRKNFGIHQTTINSVPMQLDQITNEMLKTNKIETLVSDGAKTNIPAWAQSVIAKHLDWLGKGKENIQDAQGTLFMALQSTMDKLSVQQFQPDLYSGAALAHLQSGNINAFLQETFEDDLVRTLMNVNGQKKQGKIGRYSRMDLKSNAERRVADLLDYIYASQGKNLHTVNEELDRSLNYLLQNSPDLRKFIQETSQYEELLDLTPTQFTEILTKVRANAQAFQTGYIDEVLVEHANEFDEKYANVVANLDGSAGEIPSPALQSTFTQRLADHQQTEFISNYIDRHYDSRFDGRILTRESELGRKMSAKDQAKLGNEILGELTLEAEAEWLKNSETQLSNIQLTVTPTSIEEFQLIQEYLGEGEMGNAKITDGKNEFTFRPGSTGEVLLYSKAENKTYTLSNNGVDARGVPVSHGMMPGEAEVERDRIQKERMAYQRQESLTVGKGQIPLVKNFSGDYKDISHWTGLSPYDNRIAVNRFLNGAGASVVDFETTGTAQAIGHMGELNQILEISSRQVRWNETTQQVVEPLKKDNWRRLVKPNQAIQEAVHNYNLDTISEQLRQSVGDFRSAQEFLKNSNEVNIMMNIAKYSRLKKTNKNLYSDHANLLSNIFGEARVKELHKNPASFGLNDYYQMLEHLNQTQHHAVSGIKYLNQYGKPLNEALTEFNQVVGKNILVAQFGQGAEIPWLHHNYRMAGISGSGVIDNDWVEMIQLAREIDPSLKNAKLETQVKAAGRLNIGTDIYDAYFNEQHIASADTAATRNLFGHYMRQVQDRPDMRNFEFVRESDYLVKFDTTAGEASGKGVYRIAGVQENHIDLISLDGKQKDQIVGVDRQTFEQRFHSQYFAVDDLATAEAYAESLTFDDARRNITEAQTGLGHMVSNRRKLGMIGDTPGYVEDADLVKMNQVYNEIIDSGRSIDELTRLEQKIVDNGYILNEGFETNRYKYVSQREIDAANLTKEYFNSAEAELDQLFLRDVNRLEQVGVIDEGASRDIIRQWNEEKIARGEAAGRNRATRPIAGLMDASHGNTTMYVRTGSVNQIVHSLWEITNSHAKTLDAPEGEAKRKAINEFLIPHLEKAGMISRSDTWTDATDTRLKLQSVAQQLQNHYQTNYLDQGILGDTIVDPTKPLITSKNDALYQQMNGYRQEVINSYAGQMSLTQRATYENILGIEREMARMVGGPVGAIEGMNTFQLGSPERMIEGIVALGGYGEGEDFQHLIYRNAREIQQETYSQDPEIRKTAYKELTRRASYYSGPDQSDITGLVGSQPNQVMSARLEAMEALNWVDVTRTSMIDGQSLTTKQLAEMSLDDATSFIRSATVTNITETPLQEHIFSGTGPRFDQYTGMKLGDFTHQQLTQIENAGYLTKYNQENVQRLLQTLPNEANQTVQQTVNQTLSDLDDTIHPSTVNPARKVIEATDFGDWEVPLSGRNAPTGYIERGVNQAFDTAVQSLKSSPKGWLLGGAGVVGAGLFFNNHLSSANAITPESREYNNPENQPNVSYQNTLRLEENGQGMQGMSVNVSGRHNGNLSGETIGQLINQGFQESGIPTNINIRTQNDTNSVSRDWLQQRFAELLNTGYVNGG